MRIISTLSFLLLCISVFAQPSNDDCSNLIDLGVAPVCDKSTIYSNINATPSDIGTDNSPNCFVGNPPKNDVWFSFTTAADIVDYQVVLQSSTLNNVGIKNIQLAIYRGACATDAMTLSECVIASTTATTISLPLNNLTPNEIYFIRVDSYGGNENEGEFTLCVNEKAPDVNITEGSSSNCSGYLYDSGGPDGNYSDSEDFIFTICPEEPTSCLSLNFEYFNIGYGQETLVFYNGNSTDAPVIESLDGFSNSSYTGGSVCYQVFADSCMTIRFTSDESVNLEGFKAYWECSPDECPKQEKVEVAVGAEKEVIEDFLSSSTVDVTLDTIKCGDEAYGTFTSSDLSDLGIARGLILTSGKAVNAIGPNNTPGISESIGTPGDSDLDTLSVLYSDGAFSNDACIVEVDLVAYGERASFEYIFGSEEYAEFVDQFTDIFALLASGPGITGIPEINNQENLAVLPNGSFIEINTVNHEDNWQYYRNNSNGLSVQYDGLTSDSLGIKKSLTASFVTQPCSTYHLKFAVADRADSALDSGVFISEISSAKPTIVTNFNTGINYFVEKCLTQNDSISIIIPEGKLSDLSYNILIKGTATNGVDYQLDLPSTITFLTGETVLKFPIEVFDDNITEGVETIIIEFVQDVGCKDIVVNSHTIEIKDELQVEINSGQDTLLTCYGEPVIIEADGANNYLWSPFNIFENPFLSIATITDENFEEGWISVKGSINPFTVAECEDTDSIYVRTVTPVVNIVPSDTLRLCVGDSIMIKAENNVNDEGLVWYDSFDWITDPTTSEPYVSPYFSSTGTIVAEVSSFGCSATDTLIVVAENFNELNPTFQDTTVCQGDTLELFIDNFVFQDQVFNWTPDDVVQQLGFANYAKFVVPEEDLSLNLNTTSASDLCGASYDFNIKVLTNKIEINEGDSLRLCLGDSLQLNVTTDPIDGNTITWTPSTGVSDPMSKSVYVKPEVTTVYTVSLENEACSRSYQTTVYVDSLPDLSIEVLPLKDPYCKGEPVTFVTAKYSSPKFPLIEHLWSPSTGVQNELTDLNLAVVATSTTDYIRVTTNGACTEKDTVKMNVIEPSIDINVQDTLVCSFKDLPLSFSANGKAENIEWSADPSVNIACNDCMDAVVSVGDQDLVVSVQADIDGCPTSDVAKVDIINYNGYAKVLEDPTFSNGTGNCNELYFVGDQITIEAVPTDQPPSTVVYNWAQDGQAIEQKGKEIETIVDTDVSNLDFSNCKPVNYAWSFVDENGCEGQGGVDITVGRRFAVPNTFSPNNDQNNDVFRLIDRAKNTSNITINRFSVYNRWSQNVFDCDEPECAINTGWDGTFKGQEQPSGTYMFYIEVSTGDGLKETFKGDLLLLR